VKSESKDKCSSSQKSKVEEMENLGLTAEDLTPHVWDLAIHFFYLQLMWARKKLAQDTGQCTSQDSFKFFITKLIKPFLSHPNGNLSTFQERSQGKY
jgi:hypothetical protein